MKHLHAIIHNHIMGRGKGAKSTLPPPGKPMPFPSEKGVNYVPKKHVGNRTK